MTIANQVHELCKGEVHPKVLKAIVGMADRIAHLENANRELCSQMLNLIRLAGMQNAVMDNMATAVNKVKHRFGDIQSEKIDEEMEHRISRNMGEVQDD